jgi:hypothetical protein|tara:strand:+ start:351 stop:854 length:504 start_codon:yes stop_codon:yes gene_type:complete
MYNLTENYMSNVDEVMSLVKKHEDKFRVRDGGQSFRTDYGDARLKQIHQDFMPEELREAIFRTIPIKWTDRLNYCINKYEAGDYIPRHKDSNGGYWMFKLVFLSSDKPHFKYWDEQDNAHMVAEKPGAMFNMRLGTPHAVTEIGEDENPKYSLCIMQGIDENVRKVA